MPRTARRTVAKVKSSAMRPRQPLVPNLMGVEPAVVVVAIEQHSTHSAEQFVQVGLCGVENAGGVPLQSRHASSYVIPDCAGYVRVDARGAENRESGGDEEVGGVREYYGCAS